MLNAAQFTIAKTWNQHKCSSTDDWIKKLCMYIYTFIHTQWNSTSIFKKKLKFCLLQQDGWIWRPLWLVKLARTPKPNIIYFLLFMVVDTETKTNVMNTPEICIFLKFTPEKQWSFYFPLVEFSLVEDQHVQVIFLLLVLIQTSNWT